MTIGFTLLVWEVRTNIEKIGTKSLEVVEEGITGKGEEDLIWETLDEWASEVEIGTCDGDNWKVICSKVRGNGFYTVDNNSGETKWVVGVMMTTHFCQM